MVPSQLRHLLWSLHPPRSQGSTLVYRARRFLPSLQDPDDFEIVPRSGVSLESPFLDVFRAFLNEGLP